MASRICERTYYGGYIQDDWRLLPNFTINFGIRYEFARSPVEINNHSLFFSPELQQVVLAGQGVRPDIVDPDYNNWAPRFGFNWTPKFAQELRGARRLRRLLRHRQLQRGAVQGERARRSSRRRR